MFGQSPRPTGLEGNHYGPTVRRFGCMSTYRTFVGTYTDGSADGIYRCLMDEPAGTLRDIELAAATENPSFLAAHPDHRTLYAVNEVETGAVTAFEIDDGDLRRRNRQVIGPADPCHCTVDPTGRYLFVAHYSDGAVSMLPIREDGALGESTVFDREGSSVNPDRQAASHPHSVNLAPGGEYLYVPDLGTDEMAVYEVARVDGTLTDRDAVSVHEGAGPRHLAFGPTGDRAYLINELDSTLSSFAVAAGGRLEHVDTVSTLDGDFDGDNYTADVHVHPSGEHVYGSNRGHDSIAVIDCRSDDLRLVETTATRGERARNFALSPQGTVLFAANAESETVVPFAIDRETGALAVTGDQFEIPHPVCITTLDRR
jgi:6-phosphogluconolactonase